MFTLPEVICIGTVAIVGAFFIGYYIGYKDTVRLIQEDSMLKLKLWMRCAATDYSNFKEMRSMGAKLMNFR